MGFKLSKPEKKIFCESKHTYFEYFSLLTYMQVYVTIVYLSGTEEPSSWLGALSIKFLKLKVSRLA